jgi:hypothetical protein
MNVELKGDLRLPVNMISTPDHTRTLSITISICGDETIEANDATPYLVIEPTQAGQFYQINSA